MKIKKDTIVRTIVLFVALINMILTSTGHSVLPFTDEEIIDGISVVATIGASVWAWWKNNSFTPNAIEADEILKKLKEKGDE